MRLFRASDERLARRGAHGDESAFAEIFRRYHQELYRFCRAILGNQADAEDALQSTMARVMQALPGERRQILLRPWLYRIARNESLSVIRARSAAAPWSEEVSPPQPAADAVLEEREAVRALVRDLASLPERQRSALVVRELSGLNYDEVALAMHVSPQAARQAVYEARVALGEFEQGRAMECELVRATISERDARLLRGRKIRAHMRDCTGCDDFARAIDARRATLPALAPPLPAAAAAALIAAAGAGSAQVGGLAGGAASGVAGVSAGTAGLKSLGVIAVATAAIGAGAGTLAGIELPLSQEAGSQRAEGAPAPEAVTPFGFSDESGSAEGDGPRTASSRKARGERPGSATRGGEPRAFRDAGPDGGESSERAGGSGGSPGKPAAREVPGGGASGEAQARGGRPLVPPGSSVATDRSNGQNATPRTGSPEHAQAGGPPAHSSSGGEDHPTDANVGNSSKAGK